jgi:hypothetical protein
MGVIRRLLYAIFFVFAPVNAGEIVLNEYAGINEAISNSYAYQVQYKTHLNLQPSIVLVTSQLYSSDDGYYNIPQNFAIRLMSNFESENWDLSFGVLRWSRTNVAFHHKTAYELSFGMCVKDIEFRLTQYTDQYQNSNNFNLTSIYVYKEY